MPIIRYKIGDLAKHTDRACTCGRGLPVIEEIVGRTVEFLTTPDGRRVSGFFFLRKLRQWPQITRYQVRQPSLDRIEVLLESSEALDSEWMENRAQEFATQFGQSVQFVFTQVDHIPLTSGGKYLFVQSAVPVDLDKARS
jgi:phenylacetate-CoA ligase